MAPGVFESDDGGRGGGQRTAAHRIALLIGVGLLIRTGYAVVLQRRALLEEGEDPNAFTNPPRVLIQVMVAIVFSLYGAIGLFGVLIPIRVADLPKPNWDALHSRPSFRLLPNRSCHARDLLEALLPSPPAAAAATAGGASSFAPGRDRTTNGGEGIEMEGGGGGGGGDGSGAPQLSSSPALQQQQQQQEKEEEGGIREEVERNLQHPHSS